MNLVLLFFILGILVVQFRNDLKILDNFFKFIFIYLLLLIGFKGGNELLYSYMDQEIFGFLFFGVFLVCMIFVVVFFIFKKKVNIKNVGVIVVLYGLVSVVIFVIVIFFLDFEGVIFDGYMIVVMVLMEVLVIIMVILLI